jgi:hypothetical protein
VLMSTRLDMHRCTRVVSTVHYRSLVADTAKVTEQNGTSSRPKHTIC